MKIGIVTEYKKNTVNYGNNLQVYALNAWLRRQYPEYEIKTYHFTGPARVKRKFVSAKGFIIKVWGRLRRTLTQEKSLEPKVDRELVKTRLAAFAAFQKEYLDKYCRDMTWQDLCRSDADVFIVGSDIVWLQSAHVLNRIKFLDFRSRKKAVKMAYAASFGENRIPVENQRAVRKYLEKFDAISVREKTAIALLGSIGVGGAVHALDPTLLLTAQEWSALEKQPADTRLPLHYAFVYLLGPDPKQMDQISHTCAKNGLKVVTVPFASGVNDPAWAGFGDVPLPACSPQEWIWCIHHADCVITDSFHGIVFSTIFERKFLAVRRHYTRDINVRMLDYLDTIRQRDKMTDMQAACDLAAYTWDYAAIRRILDAKIQASQAFLAKAIQGA